MKVSVNLSVAQFESPDLVASVIRALAASGLEPGRLELEVTESILIANSELAHSVLSSLRSIGVKIALDDFGAGYSSLSYLRSFPVDKLKIDRSFISTLDDRSAVLLRAIANVGLGLNIPTVAEGVETEEQLARVRAEGCTEMQGYLFSRPRSAKSLRELLVDRI
jgi:EAL domain-containing protein (putative c-di-GMP-specific phosphodiesterase class I)